MKASLYHIQLNVLDPKKSVQFYKEFLGFFGYTVIDESPEHVGLSNGTTDFWVIATEEKHKKILFHRKNTGINHLAFRVSSREEVDVFCKEFLKPRKIAVLYGSPRLFPEYSKDYYAVFFEDPDKIKLEVTYTTETSINSSSPS